MTTSFRLSTRRFGELLIERGKLTTEQVETALKERQDPRERLGQTMVRTGMLDEMAVVELLAEQFSLSIATANVISQADPDAVQLVPEHLARQAVMLALRREENYLDVAVADPLDVVSLDHLRALTGCVLRVQIARASDLVEAIDEFYQQIRAT
jgi:type IV pilus assembly protein PilB